MNQITVAAFLDELEKISQSAKDIFGSGGVPGQGAPGASGGDPGASSGAPGGSGAGTAASLGVPAASNPMGGGGGSGGSGGFSPFSGPNPGPWAPPAGGGGGGGGGGGPAPSSLLNPARQNLGTGTLSSAESAATARPSASEFAGR